MNIPYVLAAFIIVVIDDDVKMIINLGALGTSLIWPHLPLPSNSFLESLSVLAHGPRVTVLILQNPSGAPRPVLPLLRAPRTAQGGRR